MISHIRLILGIIFGIPLLALFYIGLNAMGMYAEVVFSLGVLLGGVYTFFLYVLWWRGLRKSSLGRSVIDEAISQNVIEGLILLNRDETVYFVNDKILEYFNLNKDQGKFLTGMHWSELFNVTDVCDLIKKKYKIVGSLKSDQEWEGSIRLDRTFTGIEKYASDLSDERYFRITLEPFKGNYYVLVIKDISDFKEAEYERDRAHDRLLQSQKSEAVGRLVGGIAHDFNNILASISGYAEFLEEDLEGQDQLRKFASNILEGTEQAKRIIEQIQVFSRNNETTKGCVEINRVVDETLSLLRAGLPHTVDVRHDYKSMENFVYGNVPQISQILVNLTVNALQALEGNKPSGELSVTVDRHLAEDSKLIDIDMQTVPLAYKDMSGEYAVVSEGRIHLQLGSFEAGKEYVCVAVTDTGCGISEEHIREVFEPFYTTRNADEGSGMGLAVVLSVLARHEGVLVMDTVEGKGSRFSVYIPVFVAKRNPMPVIDETDVSETEVKGRVLVVEDQDSVRLMMERMIARLGYDVVSHVDGTDALDAVREDPYGFDLIITDQVMPKMNGTDLAYELSQDFDDLPIILISGYSKSKLEDAVRDCPLVVSFMKKPVNKKALSQEIMEAIEQMPRASEVLLDEDGDEMVA